MGAYDRFADSLRRAGRPMPLKRRIGTTGAFAECAVYGRSRSYQPQELVGLVVQGDRKVRIAQRDIAAAGWPGPPKKGDFLDGGAVQGAEPLYEAEALVGFVVWVRG